MRFPHELRQYKNKKNIPYHAAQITFPCYLNLQDHMRINCLWYMLYYHLTDRAFQNCFKQLRFIMYEHSERTKGRSVNTTLVTERSGEHWSEDKLMSGWVAGVQEWVRVPRPDKQPPRQRDEQNQTWSTRDEREAPPRSGHSLKLGSLTSQRTHSHIAQPCPATKNYFTVCKIRNVTCRLLFFFNKFPVHLLFPFPHEILQIIHLSRFVFTWPFFIPVSQPDSVSWQYFCLVACLSLCGGLYTTAVAEVSPPFL